MALESEQALEAGLEVVAAPDATDAGDADVDVLQAQLVGDALGAVGAVLQGGCGDLLASTSSDTRFRCGPRGPRRCSTRAATPPTWKARRTCRTCPGGAHDAAGLGDVLQLLSKIQQRELPSGTLGKAATS